MNPPLFVFAPRTESQFVLRLTLALCFCSFQKARISPQDVPTAAVVDATQHAGQHAGVVQDHISMIEANPELEKYI